MSQGSKSKFRYFTVFRLTSLLACQGEVIARLSVPLCSVYTERLVGTYPWTYRSGVQDKIVSKSHKTMVYGPQGPAPGRSRHDIHP